jgi:effector-binding domain-containing protein
MSYEFEVKDVPAMTVLATRATCRHDEIGARLAEILPHAVRRAGPFVAGPPLCIYREWRDEDCDIEAGVPVKGEPDLFGDWILTHVPAHRAVTVVHSGGPGTLSEAHRALQRWLAEQGKELAGAPWESYPEDLQQVGSHEARTVVGWPVA